MPRYVAQTVKPRADWIDDDGPLLRDFTVDDKPPVNTGLVTASGVPIMRLPNPIGFGRDREW